MLSKRKKKRGKNVERFDYFVLNPKQSGEKKRRRILQGLFDKKRK